jgi:hypothetical protein
MRCQPFWGLFLGRSLVPHRPPVAVVPVKFLSPMVSHSNLASASSDCALCGSGRRSSVPTAPFLIIFFGMSSRWIAPKENRNVAAAAHYFWRSKESIIGIRVWGPGPCWIVFSVHCAPGREVDRNNTTKRRRRTTNSCRSDDTAGAFITARRHGFSARIHRSGRPVRSIRQQMIAGMVG